jgi:hypothetical protein
MLGDDGNLLRWGDIESHWQLQSGLNAELVH